MWRHMAYHYSCNNQQSLTTVSRNQHFRIRLHSIAGLVLQSSVSQITIIPELP